MNKGDFGRLAQIKNLTIFLGEIVAIVTYERAKNEAFVIDEVFGGPGVAKLDDEDMGGNVNSNLSLYITRVISDWK